MNRIVIKREGRSTRTPARLVFVAACVAVFAVVLMGLSHSPSSISATATVTEKAGVAAPVPVPAAMPAKVSLADAVARDGKYIVRDAAGGDAVLSLDPRLQRRAEAFLKSNNVAFGAVVAIEPATGRVLAYAEHSAFDPTHSLYSIAKPYKAASLFKMVTAEAILAEKKIPIDEVQCYHGGRRRLSSKLLVEDPRRDRRCTTFEQAMGHSTNVVFARLAHKNLTPDLLASHAMKFFFDSPIPFEVAVEQSVAQIPPDADGMAITAAGFGEVTITPLHAAMIAAAVANGGVMMKPTIVDEVRGPAGALARKAEVMGRSMSTEVSELLSLMMYTTTTEGTARKAFRKKRGAPDFKHGIPVAGKTGSLADKDPYYREYTWYAGFAPVDDPKIAVAALVINHQTWKTKGSYAAREIFEEYFRNHPVVAAGPRPAINFFEN